MHNHQHCQSHAPHCCHLVHFAYITNLQVEARPKTLPTQKLRKQTTGKLFIVWTVYVSLLATHSHPWSPCLYFYRTCNAGFLLSHYSVQPSSHTYYMIYDLTLMSDFQKSSVHWIIIIIGSTALQGPWPSSEASASFPFPLLRSSNSSLPKS
jgi:hypothetical protein